MVRSCCLLAAVCCAVVIPTPALGQTIRGIVMEDSTSQPIVGAEVTVLDTLDTTITQTISDSEGRFTVAVTPGDYTFRVLRIGYAPTLTTVLEVTPDRDYVGVTIKLPLAGVLGDDAPYALSPVVVEAPPVERYLADYYRHEELGFGDFTRRETFERWNPQQPSDVVRRMKGFLIVPNPNYLRPLPDGMVDTREYVMRVGRAQSVCEPLLYVDGAYIGDPRRFDIDEIPIIAVAAIEAYSSRVQVPIEYSRPGSECGVIALWTRAAEPGELGSPFEFGLRFGGALAGEAFAGGRLGIHLVTPFVGPLEFYPALYFVSSTFSSQEALGNSGWMAQFAVRAMIAPEKLPLHIGTGLVLVKQVFMYRGLPEDVDLEPRHTLFAGFTTDLGPTRPFVEIHLLDALRLGNADLQAFFGIGVQL